MFARVNGKFLFYLRTKEHQFSDFCKKLNNPARGRIRRERRGKRRIGMTMAQSIRKISVCGIDWKVYLTLPIGLFFQIFMHF